MNWIFGHSLLNLNFEGVVKNSDLLLKLHLMRFLLKYKIPQMSCGFDTNLAPSLVMPVSQKSCKRFEVFNIGGICNRTKMPLSVWALYSAHLVRCVMFQSRVLQVLLECDLNSHLSMFSCYLTPRKSRQEKG